MSKNNPDALKALGERLIRLTAQMQSGVAFTQQADWENAGIPKAVATQLKHLQVGLNAARTETVALARLLEQKGVCTMEEYLESCCLEMEREVDRYERLLAQLHPGTSIRVGAAGSMGTGTVPVSPHPGHEIVVCSCGKVIRQCRCIAADKPRRVETYGCDACKAKRKR